MKTHDEAAFEATIAEHLVDHGGYTLGHTEGFDAERALMPADLFGFIAETQAKPWGKLHDLHGAKLEPLFLEAYAKAVTQRGALDVLRHGLRFYGKQINLATFAPAHGLNPEVQRQYDANRLVVVRQLHHDPKDPGLSLDLALFVNGVPVVTAELKNPRTGQPKLETEHLSKLIEVVNDRFGTEFTDADQLFFDGVEAHLVEDGHLDEAAQANTQDDFALVARKALEEAFVDRHASNGDIVERFFGDKAFKRVVEEWFVGRLYEKLRHSEEGANLRGQGTPP